MAVSLDDYRRYAVDHGKYTLQGDAEATNRGYDSLKRAFLELVDQGKARDLFRFYDDADPWVQAWAAAHTLEIHEARAIVKLHELVDAGIPHVSTDAKYTLQEWNAWRLAILARRAR
jgi:hypothetical protein